eukprot:TRINITY_DN3056_c0_g1_i5.p1 TRINITY_DN3056_c0_g1~~TRINITY_DN3056_c0_g1_i5.p1  ORF type:complete len:391 (-),score=76.81 TRINITY_DN3056_c0_g1_i5:32-1204(-)
MSVPTLDHALNIVQVMCHELSRGHKIAIHCHAGLGRTGLVISCYLVYGVCMTADQAIEQVRLHRPRSIQTKKQVSFVQLFERYVVKLRQVFPSVSIEEHLKRQYRCLHGNEAKQLRWTPKVVLVLCARIATLAEADEVLPAATPDDAASSCCACTAIAAVSADGGDPASANATDSDDVTLTLASCRAAVNAGDWDRIATCRDFALLWELLAEWLVSLQQPCVPPQLAERAAEFVDGEAPFDALCEAVPTASQHTLRRVAALLSLITRRGIGYEAYAQMVHALAPLQSRACKCHDPQKQHASRMWAPCPGTGREHAAFEPTTPETLALLCTIIKSANDTTAPPPSRLTSSVAVGASEAAATDVCAQLATALEKELAALSDTASLPADEGEL